MINYYLLTKPGIILGNLITVAAGFLLASKGHFDGALFLGTLFGLGFIIASGCVFNNCMDRGIDKKMMRTQGRALVKGSISLKEAIVFGLCLGLIGVFLLIVYTNPLTVAIACMGFFVYVFIYSLWKSHTIYGTAIGSIAGAVPPVVGYCAVSAHFDTGAFILFLMLIFWQMPHFFAIALSHLEDYALAGIPVLPLKKGILRTKIHMALYIIGFILTSAMLTLFHYTGYLYLAATLGLGTLWLIQAIAGFAKEDFKQWGYRMFCLSLVLILAICIVIPLDVV
ncbi:Protoheme IX farnesyltransferase [Chlamydiales bacterium STE3]|nr:Protoheme IX farnesyltransferase [Chlamydiales bacterium STE3]